MTSYTSMIADYISYEKGLSHHTYFIAPSGLLIRADQAVMPTPRGLTQARRLERRQLGAADSTITLAGPALAQWPWQCLAWHAWTVTPAPGCQPVPLPLAVLPASRVRTSNYLGPWHHSNSPEIPVMSQQPGRVSASDWYHSDYRAVTPAAQTLNLNPASSHLTTWSRSHGHSATVAQFLCD